MPNQSGKIILVLILIVLILGAAAYFYSALFVNKDHSNASALPVISDKKSLASGRTPERSYTSDSFQMAIMVPEGFNIEDDFPLFAVKEGNRRVEVVRNGTNFQNLEEYIKDFDKKRNVREVKREEKALANYPQLARELSYGDSSEVQKSIYIYVDNSVYIFSTTDKSLYHVLDQIVQSFKYEPSSEK